MVIANGYLAKPGEQVLVLGLGRSGCAAAELLVDLGMRVTVADAAEGSAPAECVATMESHGVTVIRNATAMPPGRFVLCVVSPGLDEELPVVQEAFDRCGEVISELELGFRNCQCPVLAVTGTNGKSTLTKLLSDMLNASGLRSEPSGNYGTPLCESARRSGTLDWIVAEVSSFQLELVQRFRPKIGIMLNVQPDHLGRHKTMSHYTALKARLFRAMQAGDRALVYAPDAEQIRSAVPEAQATDWITFGTDSGCAVRYDAARHVAVHAIGGQSVEVSLLGTSFDNPVTGLAAAAAVAAGTLCGLSADVMQAAISAFVPLSHRMQEVGQIDGVRFVDDSKATNLTAVQAALMMTNAPVRLIVGGQLKENDLDFIKEVLKNRVQSAYLIGESSGKFKAAWGNCIQCVMSGDLKTAVDSAMQDANPGDVVLLSPACASFDQFRSYADRGDRFKDYVHQLAKRRNEEKKKCVI
ncbi:MAG TPA: UDP-N-acetylmuramoyl-L-alanine--D-glutamate ligase [Verrucomicrobia bacterium]|nr:UDP-N-acetylmuramoyl-L-alanine--D-glutamate ligase [Verrucomicrobiota bacterium]